MKCGCEDWRKLAGVICGLALAGLCDMLGVTEGGGGALSGAVGSLSLGCGRDGPEVDAALQTGASGGRMG